MSKLAWYNAPAATVGARSLMSSVESTIHLTRLSICCFLDIMLSAPLLRLGIIMLQLLFLPSDPHSQQCFSEAGFNLDDKCRRYGFPETYLGIMGTLMRSVDSLLFSISSEAGSHPSYCSTDTVFYSVAVIGKLALGLRTLALGVLLLAFLLQTLRTE